MIAELVDIKIACFDTALRGAATLKARALKDVWNIAAVIPVEKGMGVAENASNGNSNSSFSGELVPEDNFLGICSREFLARGCELLKRTRKGKIHSIYSIILGESYSYDLCVSTFQFMRWLI